MVCIAVVPIPSPKITGRGTSCTGGLKERGILGLKEIDTFHVLLYFARPSYIVGPSHHPTTVMTKEIKLLRAFIH